MKKGLAVFSGSAVVHKLMQDGTVVLGTAANPAAVTISGSLTASANSIEVGNVGGEFQNTKLGDILVELKGAATSGTSDLSSSLKTYIDAQDSAEAAARAAGDAAVAATASANLTSVSSSIKTYVDAADAVLQSAIDAEKARIDTILSGADVDLNQFVEVVQFVNDLSGANYDALMDAVSDINADIAAVSGALAQEIVDRAAAVAGVQSNLDSVSGSLAAVIQGNFDIQQSDAELLRSDIEATQANLDSVSGSFASALADEVQARIDGDAAVQSNLDSVSGSLKAAIDAIQAGASGDTTALSSSFSASLAAEIARATAAEALVQSNLDSVSGSIKAYVDAADGVLQTNIDNASGSLKTYVDQKITDLVNGADAALDTLKEIGDRLNADSGSLANALLTQITQVQADLDAEELRATTAEATISGNLATEKARAEGVEAGLQAQIDASAFTVNGISVLAKSGSFSIVTGSANLTVATNGSNVVVDLASVVSVGSLTATGSVTSTGGDLVASHGAMKATLDSSVDSARLTALSDATNLAAGQFDGMSFYLKGAATGVFARANCWYFCQDGVWFDAPFFAGE